MTVRERDDRPRPARTAPNRRRTVRFAPVEFGYGPLGKALHIAREMRRLAGDTIRMELVVSRNFQAPVDEELFDRVLTGMSGQPPADGVVTIMNVGAIQASSARGEPVYVVDSLAWLWDEPLPVQKLIRRYFYQDLPILPVPTRNLRGMPNAMAIPAIGQLPGAPRGNGAPPGDALAGVLPGLVVSLSGVETPTSRMAAGNLWYPPYILESLEHLAEAGELDVGRLALFGNNAVLRGHAGPGMLPAVRGGTQHEFGAVARSAGTVVCPPGLTTIVECLRGGVGLKFLPPQNYSQVKLMKAFVAAAGFPALPWVGPLAQWLEEATLPEAVGAMILHGMVAAERLSRRYVDPEALRTLLRQEPPALGPAAVEALLGPDDGALTVAQGVLADLLP